MVTRSNTYLKKWGITLLALALAAMLPMSALAQATADATAAATMASQQPMPVNSRATKNASLDVSTLTDEQKAAYEKAQTLYEQIEDAVLGDLVTAGVVSQEDLASYQALREAKKSLTDLDQSGWTAEQLKAYYEACAKSGNDRKIAMQALADAGQLTQAQADVLSADQQQGLWAKLQQNESTNTAIQTAMSVMRQAGDAFRSTLKDAGIKGMPDLGGLGTMGRGGREGQGLMNGDGRMPEQEQYDNDDNRPVQGNRDQDSNEQDDR